MQAVVPGTGTIAFKYDPFGRRIQKSAPLGTTNYLYDWMNVIKEVDNADGPLAKYTRTTKIDEPLSQFRSGTTSYYEQDGIGSVSSLSNPGGAVANSYTYDSFGKLIASSGTLINPFQYAGRELDPETGLLFNRARYFDPSAGRFLSEDPIQFRGGMNLYAYARNNSMDLTDPFGFQGCNAAQWAQSPNACAGPTGPNSPYQGPDGLWKNTPEWPPEPTPPVPDDGPTPPPSPQNPGPQCHRYQNDPDTCTRAFEACVAAANDAGEHCAKVRGFGLYGGLEVAGGIAGFAFGGPAGALLGVEGMEMLAAGAGGIGAATCTQSADERRIKCAQQEMDCLTR